MSLLLFGIGGLAVGPMLASLLVASLSLA